MVTYKEAVAYLEEIPFFTKKNTPEKTAEFYKYVTKHLPLPQQTKVIHVAGTNDGNVYFPPSGGSKGAVPY